MAPELVRSVLERIGDKWSVIVICRLGPEPRRFNELRRLVDGITQRMLTATLRGLERDGLVTRSVFPTVPLRVEYALTDSGRTLLDVVQSLVGWAGANAEAVHVARTEFDRRSQQQPQPVGAG